MNAPIEACPQLLDVAGGVRWWLADCCWEDAARRATADIENPASICGHRLLKSGLRRLVFDAADAPSSGCIVKAFPLGDLRDRLKHRKYAWSEARNLAEARRRAVPAPVLHGWGQARRGGTVRWNAVLMQRIDGCDFYEALARCGDDAARGAIMRRCALLFRSLFLAGCNHIDLKPEAVRFGEDESRDAVMDFQYCTFAATPRLETIMAQAGHFAHWWEKERHPEPGRVEKWISTLLDVLEVPADRCSRALQIVERNQRLVPSIATRLRQ